MSNLIKITGDAIWTKSDSGVVFVGCAPNGPILELSGSGNAIFLTVVAHPSGVTVEDLVARFQPIAGLEEGELRLQIESFIGQLTKQGVFSATLNAPGTPGAE